MALITQAQIGAFRTVEDTLKKAIRAELRDVWTSVAHLGNDKIKATLVAVVPELVDKYGASSAAVAATWFEELTGARAIVPDLYTPEAYRASTRWALGPMYQAERNPAEAYAHLVAAATRHMKDYGRGVLDTSVERTPNAYYARVPTGPSTCEFCIVLASRGPVYTSRRSAQYRSGDGNRYHNDCDCQPVPMRGSWDVNLKDPRGMQWSGDKVEGYDFESLYHENYAPYHTSGDSINDVVAKMREARRI